MHDRLHLINMYGMLNIPMLFMPIRNPLKRRLIVRAHVTETDVRFPVQFTSGIRNHYLTILYHDTGGEEKICQDRCQKAVLHI